MIRLLLTLLVLALVHVAAIAAIVSLAISRISPAQSGEASATAAHSACTVVATPLARGATEGGAIFHTDRSPEISNGDSPAPGRVVGVASIPVQPENSRVTKQSAGAARGGRAGIGFVAEKAKATSARAAGTAAPIASHSAGMVVTPAAHQEARRV